MPIYDLRSFIEILKENEQLSVVDAEVDWRDEIQGIVTERGDFRQITLFE